MLGPRDFVVIGLLGGVLALDRTPFFQTMASRPLVASTLAGCLLGEPRLGLLTGLLLELFWLTDLPVGSSVPPDDTLAAVLAAGFAASASGAWGIQARVALGVLLAIPFGFAGRWLDIRVRRSNAALYPRARAELGQYGAARLGRAHLIGALRFFAAGAAASAGGLVAGWALIQGIASRLPRETPAVLELTACALPLIGAAAVLAGLRSRRSALLFSAGLLGWMAIGHAEGLLGLLSGQSWRP